MESYYKRRQKVKNKKKVMKALKEQRGKYDETFELWNAKQAELLEKQRDRDEAYRQNKKINPNSKRAPNKTDLYDKI
tara:strand:- start:518 stop:748 length:231 start_codon:yes stop_codon:yes gene_type:complete